MRLRLITLATLTFVQVSFASPAPKNEDITPMLQGKRALTSLLEIREKGLIEGTTGIDLWSGSYWPHFQGSVASRYRDPSFIPLIKDEVQYSKLKEAYEKKPLLSYENTDNLSPAEKYDLLVGDHAMTLTNYAWELGKKTKKGDKVATWRGLCDGWSSASQMMPRPKHPVTVAAEDGQKITFFPEDIKALGTLLYAKAQKNPIFLGKRCYSSLLGFTKACNEVNPGAFTLALINRVGVLKKSFIGDIAPGGQVWNYPVKKYDLTFVNVFDNDQTSKDFREVMEPFNKKNKKLDFYKEGKRNKITAYIVGVKAKVTYQNMREHNLVDDNGNAEDSVLEKEYSYDLELDANFNIVGGESMNDDLPDFIWAPNDGAFPLSIAETQGLELSVGQMAQVSSKEGQPLSTVLQKLFLESTR
jgi:hypothetical protein